MRVRLTSHMQDPAEYETKTDIRKALLSMRDSLVTLDTLLCMKVRLTSHIKDTAEYE